jgi:L-threonylcarbamoyladenylate synthase
MAPIESYSPSTVERLSRQVASVLQRSGLVAIPTETFYGLGVNPFDARAVDRLRAVKGREDAKPILVLVASINDLSAFVEQVPPAASLLIEGFWPGPLTILFPARASLPHALTAGTGLVGMRVSSCRPLCELLTRVGPLTGTSANRAGAAPARTAEAVQQALGDAVDLILDAGPTPGGLPSTVVDAHHSLRIVREGAIEGSLIEARLHQRGFSLNNS